MRLQSQMAKNKPYKWAFSARFRTGAYSWKGSRLATLRLREAVSEIRKVARNDPVLAADGAVRLMEKVWPSLQHVDSSSGAIGNAVNKTLESLIPIVTGAPADEGTRARWLDRLWQAMTDDGVEYLSPVGDRWGELCGSAEVAGQWADELSPTVKACWSDPVPGSYFHGATACLSCLLEAGRYQELLDLVALSRYQMWHYRRYGADALLALGQKAEALKYAEGSRGLNEPDSVIDRTCEDILLGSGLHEEAYQSYGLRMVANSYLARFRAIARRYPMKEKPRILADLVAMSPGEEGKWFATAKELKLYDVALELAARSPCDPKTLTRAARDYLDTEPEFAVGSALAALNWLCEGWGYEVTSLDVVEAYDRAMDAAGRLGRCDEVIARVRQLLDANDTAPTLFVRQALSRRLPVAKSTSG
jgi:tetratricopeptide (TPR) repeat protein